MSGEFYPLQLDTVSAFASGLAANQAASKIVADSLDAASYAAKYAAISAGRLSSPVVFLGDSITLGADDNATQAQGAAWPTFAAVLSGQRIQRVRNAGNIGDTTAAMLARFDTDVTPYLPKAVTLCPGTNDVGVTPLLSWSQTVQQIIAKIITLGAIPILCTIPPTDAPSPVNRRQQITQYNAWIRDHARRKGYPLVDFYAVLVNPTTGGYKAAYSSGDNIHPNAAGYLAMAQQFVTQTQGIFSSLVGQLCSDDVDMSSALYKGCFGGYSGSGLPTGWVDAAGTPAGSTLSYTTDAQVAGQMVTLTHVAAAGVRQLSYALYFGQTTVSSPATAGATSIITAGRADTAGVLFIGTPGTPTYEVVKVTSSSGGGPQTQTLASPLLYNHSAGEPVVANGLVGDEMVLSCVLTTDGGVPIRVGTSCPGAASSPQAYSFITSPVTRGVVLQRFTIPAGTTAPMNILLQAGAGTGVSSFGQVGLYNATRLAAA